MDKINIKKNGGFPPIRYIDLKKGKKEIKKERYFSAEQIKNVDIRNILKKEKSQPVINLEQKDVDVVDYI